MRNIIVLKRSMCLLMMYIILVTAIPVNPLFSQTIPEEQSNDLDTTFLIEFTLFPDVDPFISEKPIEINLEFDMRQFRRKKFVEEYVDALLYFTRPDGHRVENNIKIKSRGEFRKEYCHFPPIKLNMKNTKSDNKFLNDIKSLKLVTHCKNSRTYEQYLLKEYLIYRMYNALTEYSYRVRLMIINYIDSQGHSKPFTKYGFVIESNDHLAERIDAFRVERNNISIKQTDYQQIHLLTIFQYMIGNTDWSVPGPHNIRLFKLKDFNRLYPVPIPYDFDYSGMVNTFYAIPDEKLGIKSVRTRIYRGYCIPESEFYRYFEEFYSKKNELYYLVNNFDLLEKNHKREMIVYLDEFFNIIENPVLAKRNILHACRQ